MSKSALVDLTMDDLRTLIREEVQIVVRKTLEYLIGDPDEGLEFKPEIAERLEKFLAEQPDGAPIDDIMNELHIPTR